MDPVQPMSPPRTARTSHTSHTSHLLTQALAEAEAEADPAHETLVQPMHAMHAEASWSPSSKASKARPEELAEEPVEEPVQEIVAAEAPPSPRRPSEAEYALCGDGVLLFLRWTTIGQLHTFSGAMRRLCESGGRAPALWRAACLSLGYEAALYVPERPPALYGFKGHALPPRASFLPRSLPPMSVCACFTGGREAYGMMAWKRFFFDSLWPARNKWGDLSQQDQLQDAKDGQDFKINVCVRFRPLLEPPPDSKLSLPLHLLG